MKSWHPGNYLYIVLQKKYQILKKKWRHLSGVGPGQSIYFISPARERKRERERRNKEREIVTGVYSKGGRAKVVFHPPPPSTPYDSGQVARGCSGNLQSFVPGAPVCPRRHHFTVRQVELAAAGFLVHHILSLNIC